MEPFSVSDPLRAPHIALRIHVDALHPQTLPGNTGPSQLFGASLCAAPYMHGATPPPLPPGTPLQPYLPWTWAWRDTPATTPGFQWTFLVRMEKQNAANVFAWKPVPRPALTIYAVPEGWNDDLLLTDAVGHNGTIHETWWNAELTRLTIENAALPVWKTLDATKPPLAHAKRLDQFYTGQAEKETIVAEDEHDQHDDLFGARMLRWATANTPYNFVNRLAAILAIPSFADLQATMQGAAPGYLLNENTLRFAAAPLWSSDDYPDQGYDQLYEGANDFLIIEQAKVPVNGVLPGDAADIFLRRFYSRSVSPLKTDAADQPAHQRVSDAGGLTVEIEPWRVDLENRVARCVDLPILLLDWADAQPPGENGQAPPAGSFFDWVGSPQFVEWITCLSADLLQAFIRFPANDPATANVWLEKVIRAAANGIEKIEVEQLQHLKALAEQLLKRLGPDDPQATTAQRISALRDWMQLWRDPKVFTELRQVFGLKGAAFSEDNRIDEALQKLLAFPVLPENQVERTLGQAIISKLRDDSDTSAKKVALALEAYLRQRQALISSAVAPKPPSPRLPEATQNDAVLKSFHDYLANTRLADVKALIFGDLRRPLAHPHAFILVADPDETVVQADLPLNGDDELDEHAGALVFGRVNGAAPGPWHSLNAGLLQVRLAEDASQGIWNTYTTAQETHPPLRGAYLNQRHSVRVDYDNRPLVAVSPKRQLTKVSVSKLEAVDASIAAPREEYVWRQGSKIPALRYYPLGSAYQFLWVQLSNSGCLPEKFWLKHPAVLKLAADVEVETAPGALLSDPDRYLRRVGIATPKVAPREVIASDGFALMVAGKKQWPKLPDGVHPLSAELAPREAPKDVPLVLLFPLAGEVSKPSLRTPKELVHEITVQLGKPSTSDENWERWVSADGSATPAERVEVCANAHAARDTVASTSVQPNNAPSSWQPDDAALDNRFLIVFRRLYPGGNDAIGFVRSWLPSTNPLYAKVKNHFTDPVLFKLTPKSGLPAWVRAITPGGNAFELLPGVVTEVAIYGLLSKDACARFQAALVTAEGSANPPLGQPANMPGVVFQDTLPDEFKNFLAVSPAFFRVETAQLDLKNFPSPSQAYTHLITSAQGAKVCLGVSRLRSREEFDWVHEVIVQEQIWRWNGKPVMPEDFPGPDGAPTVELPKPLADSRGIAEKEEAFPWDGVAFHHREDGEHLAVRSMLPIVQPTPPPAVANAVSDAGDILYSDDKSNDVRALYFRFSALLRSRYFGVWPRSVQAGKKIDNAFDLWKRHVLPHRLAAPLKKPSVAIVIPLLASGAPVVEAGDTAGVLAIVREAHFEQAGLAEILECRLVESPSYKNSNGVAMPDGKTYFQAGYDPTLSTVALSPSVEPGKTEEKSFVTISGPVGLTFDQASRDPLLVNSVYFVEIDRSRLSKLVPKAATGKAAATHLYCKLRFRRTLRPGYDLPSPNTGAGANGALAESHPLSSDWTESQWIKFLPDSDALRPNNAAAEWEIAEGTVDGKPVHLLTNWTSSLTPRPKRFRYLFCVTRHDLDAAGRPATEFHSLYRVEEDGKLYPLRTSESAAALEKPFRRLMGRLMEVLVSADSTELSELGWESKFFPRPPGSATGVPSICEDTEAMVQAISPGFPLAAAQSKATARSV